MRSLVDQGYDPVEHDRAEVEADRLSFQMVLKGTEPLQEIFEQFIQSRRDLRRSERTIRDYEGDWKRYAKPALGAMAVRDVKRKDIADLHRKMADKPVRANRTLTMLHGVFEFAIERDLRDEGSNPCLRVEKYPEQPRSRYLDDAEIAALLGALDEIAGSTRVAACIRLQLFTGLRGIEVRGLEWNRIDMARRVIKLARDEGRQAARRTVERRGLDGAGRAGVRSRSGRAGVPGLAQRQGRQTRQTDLAQHRR